ncbi:Class II abasic (AP) endonuclease [Elasticomyces elasticus]|nr:Class II abasic (AP) endonuclease [Elasticomyces elasticus]KAK3645457.1 Class II abasic (AP) endonuclease [Elasticomyces elasticus]KAK4915813.1 Class II abasic (AP) endonuclease [Elasticomyces elasticus]KAK5755591.1 Class II abasic (AP) endonuclease [Elasticomyces elasticus]
MRLTTWNVNGIRNPFSYQPWNTARTFPAMFDILGSDIVVMQELKIQRKDLRDDMVLLDGWDCYFSLPKHKKGYSGVGMYTRNATCSPIRAEEGLLGVLPSPTGVPYRDLPEGESIGGYPNAFQIAELGVDPDALDAEGRCLILEFPAFVLFGVYSPANSNGLRDDFRYGFICALDCRIRNLIRAGKRVVLVGDLNVSRDELDGANCLDDMRKAGLTHEEYLSKPNRRIFNQLLIGGEVFGSRDEGREQGVLWDTTRGMHPERKGMYTHWETKINARPGNFGSRIDFVLVSESMQSWVKDANTQDGLLGSDHCPVYVDFHEMVQSHEKEIKLLDVMSDPGVFEDGKRQKEWKLTDVPAFSGKRLTEFDKRRSIKSMFAAPALPKLASTAPERSPSPTKQDLGATPMSENEGSKTKSDVSESNGTARSPALKRKASIPDKPKPSKRQKSETIASVSKGQQSLKGFFTRGKATTVESPLNDVKEELQSSAIQERLTTPVPPTPSPAGTTATNDVETFDADGPPSVTASPGSQAHSPASAFTASPTSFSARVAAVEQSQKSWSNLFARPIAPLCEGHTEPCKTMRTKKKGENQGRSFWMCARPVGPSGAKEKGTEWRCPTFIWCSDWQGKRGEEKIGDGG